MFLITHGTEWPILCWCAVKQLLTRSLFVQVIVKDSSIVLTLAHIKAYMLQTFLGLEYLHAHWILHRVSWLSETWDICAVWLLHAYNSTYIGSLAASKTVLCSVFVLEKIHGCISRSWLTWDYKRECWAVVLKFCPNYPFNLEWPSVGHWE